MHKNFNWLNMMVGLLLAIVIFILSFLGFFSDLQSFGLTLSRYINTPATFIIQTLNNTFALLNDLQGVQIENAQMRDRIARMEGELSALQNVKSENDWLRAQLNLDLSHSQSSTLAEVVKYEFVPEAGFVFTTGGESAVRVGDFVVSYNYIVGQVDSVVGNYIKIRLITASSTNIPVKIGPNSDVGILRGNNGVSSSIYEVSSAHKISAGDEVKLLNFAGLDLAQYKLGEVTEVIGTDADAVRVVEYYNPIDILGLKYVNIIPNHE